MSRSSLLYDSELVAARCEALEPKTNNSISGLSYFSFLFSSHKSIGIFVNSIRVRVFPFLDCTSLVSVEGPEVTGECRTAQHFQYNGHPT